jgi:hypothetical protein
MTCVGNGRGSVALRGAMGKTEGWNWEKTIDRRCFEHDKTNDRELHCQQKACVPGRSRGCLGSHLRRFGLFLHALGCVAPFGGFAWSYAADLPSVRIRRALVLRGIADRSLRPPLFASAARALMG